VLKALRRKWIQPPSFNIASAGNCIERGTAVIKVHNSVSLAIIVLNFPVFITIVLILLDKVKLKVTGR